MQELKISVFLPCCYFTVLSVACGSTEQFRASSGWHLGCSGLAVALGPPSFSPVPAMGVAVLAPLSPAACSCSSLSLCVTCASPSPARDLCGASEPLLVSDCPLSSGDTPRGDSWAVVTCPQVSRDVGFCFQMLNFLEFRN